MRQLVVVPILCVSVSAWAGKGGGSDGGGGALSHVSAGMSSATHGSGGSQPSSGNSGGASSGGSDNTSCCVRYEGTEVVVVGADPTLAPPSATPAPPGPNEGAHLDLYGGIQKVHDSDGSYSLSLAVADRHFRIEGAITHYYENRMEGDPLTMDMPSLVGGVRVDDHRATRVYLDAGVVGAKTHGDPVADSSIKGFVGGVTVEHAMTRQLWLLGDVHRMFFSDDIRANELRAGVRIGWLQASVRMLDFNVGPPLYGPEVGLRF
jgi:hypothetical protein